MRNLLFGILLLTRVYSASGELISMEDVLDFHRTPVRHLAFSPATRLLFVSHADDATANFDDRLDQWNVDTERMEYVYQLGEGFMCQRIFPSPEGRFLVVCCYPRQGKEHKLVLIDSQTRQVRDLHEKQDIDRVTFTPDGSRFAVITWEMRSTGSGRPSVYDTSGQLVGSAGLEEFQPVEDPYLRYYPPEKGKERNGLYVRDMKGEERHLDVDSLGRNFASTADGKYIAATTADGDLLAFRRSDLKMIFQLHMAEEGGHLCYDSVKNRFLWADQTRRTSKLRQLVIDENGKMPAEASEAARQ